MKQVLILLSVLMTFVLSASAQQKAYKVTVKMPFDQQQGIVSLAHYFGSNQYIKVDSAKVENGTVTFSGDEPLKGGLYMVVYSPAKFYDFLVTGKPAEQTMTIEADTADYVGTIKFTNSPDNDILFNYRRYLQQKNQEAQALQNDPALKGNITAIRAKMTDLQKEVGEFMKSTVSNNKGTFAAEIINANVEPEMPKTIPNRPDGRPDSTYLFNYYKAHYFDNLDFSDGRMVRTPFLQSKLDRYFKDLVYTIQDSVINDCDRVLKLAKQNNEVYRYVLWWMTNKYETIDIVGLDGVFIHLAENYYLKDADWLDSTQRAKFQERVNILKPLQTGKVFPKLQVYDLNGQEINLANLDAAYTVVVFYSPDCGHCKDAAPELVKFYEDNKGRNIKVVNISTKYEPDETKKFVDTYKTGELINGWDAKGLYDFRTNFDVYSTPTTYVLDAQKRIVGKRIPTEELTDFIDFQERKTAQSKGLGK